MATWPVYRFISILSSKRTERGSAKYFFAVLSSRILLSRNFNDNINYIEVVNLIFKNKKRKESCELKLSPLRFGEIFMQIENSFYIPSSRSSSLSCCRGQKNRSGMKCLRMCLIRVFSCFWTAVCRLT